MFIGIDLENKLHRNNSNNIVISGVITENSVDSTARICGDLGFNTMVVSDATFTSYKKDYLGKKHTAEELHAMSLANLDGEYENIYSTEQIV